MVPNLNNLASLKERTGELHMKKTKPQSTSVVTIKQQVANTIKPIIQQRLASGVSQEDISKVLQCTQPRVSNLLNDHLDKFSLDKLLDFCFRLELKPQISIQ